MIPDHEDPISAAPAPGRYDSDWFLAQLRGRAMPEMPEQDIADEDAEPLPSEATGETSDATSEETPDETGTIDAPVAAADPQPEVGPEPAAEPEPDAEAVLAPESEAEAESAPEPKAEVEPAPEPEVEAAPASPSPRALRSRRVLVGAASGVGLLLIAGFAFSAAGLQGSAHGSSPAGIFPFSTTGETDTGETDNEQLPTHSLPDGGSSSDPGQKGTQGTDSSAAHPNKKKVGVPSATAPGVVPPQGSGSSSAPSQPPSATPTPSSSPSTDPPTPTSTPTVTPTTDPDPTPTSTPPDSPSPDPTDCLPIFCSVLP